VTVVTGGGGGAARFVYAANLGDNTISGYITDQTTGALTAVPGSPFRSSGSYYSIVTDPTGRFVYAGGYSSIAVLSSDAVTGQLTSLANFGYDGSGQYNYGMAVHPSGKFLYAARATQSVVAAYMVDGGNGGLTLAGTYATGSSPYGVVVDPTGKFAYTANAGSNDVSAFMIDASTGALTPVSGSPFAVSSGAYALAVDPSGTHLYVGQGATVAAYTINTTTGVLAAVSGSPFNTGQCCLQQGGVTLDPTGRFLYTANSSNGNVSGFSIDQVSGGLTVMTGSPFRAGTNAQGIAVDASGRFVYVTSYVNASGVPGSVVALAINPTTGVLTGVAGSPFAAGSETSAITTTGAVAPSSATLVSLQINPNPPTITTSQLGSKAQLTLVGNYSDGTTQFLTESASWSLSSSTAATIGNQAGSKGLVTTFAYGTTTLTVSYGGLTLTPTLTVQAPPLVSIAVTPASPAIAAGTAIQLNATGTYSDSSTANISNQVTWSSTNTAAATVSTTGLVTGVAAGTSTITATLGSVSGTATVSVQ
jgi:6-phosphogluconolactonase (cycloisomerase 2 family)